jgi:hypothetical protein
MRAEVTANAAVSTAENMALALVVIAAPQQHFC